MKSILKKIGAGKVYAFVVRQYDRFFSSRIECSIGDIVLQRGIPSNNQLLLTSRLLDVENYIGSDNQTFPYQNLISYKKYGKNHKEEQGNLHFKELIESYRQYGYDTNSLITCDCDLSLMDGNHRMGLHLFQKIEEVNVRVIKRKAIKEYGGDWYYRMNVPTAIMENLYNKYNEIQQWLITTGNTFCAVLFSNNEDIVKNTILDMSRLTNVLKVSHLRGGYFYASRLMTLSMW